MELTLKQLKDRVSVGWKGYGTYTVEIEWHGRKYHCTSHNAPAIDRIHGENYVPDTKHADGGYTLKQAYAAFYEECKRANHLGEYNY